MASIRCVLLGVVGLLFVSVNQADAFYGRCGIWPSGYSWSAYYYVPMQMYYYPPVTVVPVVPVVPISGQRIIYANPLPAGPSQTGEPPVAPPMPPAKVSGGLRTPTIVTSRSQTGGAQVRVGFWNLSGRDVTLTVEGKSWTLPKDRAITLDMERTFAWQIDQRMQRVERIAEAETTHEVVIRE